MGNEITPTPDRRSFEELRRANQHGAEYWSARDLQPLLGYSQWRRFEEAVQRAITSCQQSGNDPAYHFAGAGKLIKHGKGGKREIPDFHLSRFACYLIAQNGDPRKPAIAEAQKYFAVQTRRQELSDAYAADIERLELREQAKHEFKALSGAAQDAGVQSHMFGVFHDAGYQGLLRRLERAGYQAAEEHPDEGNPHGSHGYDQARRQPVSHDLGAGQAESRRRSRRTAGHRSTPTGRPGGTRCHSAHRWNAAGTAAARRKYQRGEEAVERRKADIGIGRARGQGIGGGRPRQ